MIHISQCCPWDLSVSLGVVFSICSLTCCKCCTWRPFCWRQITGRRKLWMLLICSIYKVLQGECEEILFHRWANSPTQMEYGLDSVGILDWGYISQLVECLPPMHKSLIWASALHKPGCTSEIPALLVFRGSEVQGQSQLHRVNSVPTWTRDLDLSTQREGVQEAPLGYLHVIFQQYLI